MRVAVVTRDQTSEISMLTRHVEVALPRVDHTVAFPGPRCLRSLLQLACGSISPNYAHYSHCSLMQVVSAPVPISITVVSSCDAQATPA